MHLPFFVTIGVTGRRKLSPVQLERITGQVNTILNTIMLTCKEIVRVNPPIFSNTTLDVSICSCLSEGADRLVAHKGLDLGYYLDATLPFPSDSLIHARDLKENKQIESRSELQQLVEKSRRVIDFGKDRETGGLEDSNEGQLFRRAAYLDAGLAMLEQSDILFALWDGKTTDNAGGTYDIIKKAISKNIIVIWVNTEKNVPISEYIFLDGEFKSKELQNVSIRIRELFGPPRELAFINFINDMQNKNLQIPFWAHLYGNFYAKIAPKNTSSKTAIVKDDEALNPQTSPLTLPDSSIEGIRVFLKLLRHYAKLLGDLAVTVTVAVIAISIPTSWFYTIHDYFYGKTAPKTSPIEGIRIFSGLSRHYAKIYRSFFLLNCLLGALAVTVAVIAISIPTSWFCMKIFLGGIELFLLLRLWCLHKKSKDEDWQHKSINYRFLAEVVRTSNALHKQGIILPVCTALPYYDIKVPSLVTWFTRIILLSQRNFKMQGKVRPVQTEHLLEWVNGQLDYHKDKTERCERAEQQLYNLVEKIFFITIACVVSHLLGKIFMLPTTALVVLFSLALAIVIRPKKIKHAAAVVAIFIVCYLMPFYVLIHVFGILSILLPLWAMTIHAFCQYAEFKRMQNRSLAMTFQLQKHIEDLQKDTSSEEIISAAKMTAKTILDEVNEWSIQSKIINILKG